MKKLFLILALIFNHTLVFAICDISDFSKTKREIESRPDYNFLEKREALDLAKQLFREEVIECALNKEPISEQAQSFAIELIEEDHTTRPEQAKKLIDLILDRG